MLYPLAQAAMRRGFYVPNRTGAAASRILAGRVYPGWGRCGDVVACHEAVGARVDLLQHIGVDDPPQHVPIRVKPTHPPRAALLVCCWPKIL
jgi:hypothetical protein